jgi:hypothetical protein
MVLYFSDSPPDYAEVYNNLSMMYDRFYAVVVVVELQAIQRDEEVTASGKLV